MILRKFGLVTLLAAVATTATAQIPFQLLVTQGQNAINEQNGATVSFSATVGQSETAQVQATYTGTGQVTISQPPALYGSSQFKVTLANSLPVVLGPGGGISMTIVFTPTSAGASTGAISLPYVENVATSSNVGSINLTLDGTAPSFTLSYELQTNQNVVPLQPGGLIPFPSTVIGTTAQAAFNITNTGSGSGTVTGISITPGAFTLQGIPLLPATVAPNGTLAVVVLYTPTAVESDSGQITVTFGTGAPVTINLTGSGTAATFTYQILSTTPPTTVASGGTISLPGTQIGQSGNVTIRVLNSGNASGTVSAISIGGQGFSLSNVPVLPKTLASGDSLTFTVNFTPTQPGSQSGTLIVNSDTFTVSGNGLGSQLVFSYVAAGSTITLNSTNNAVVFSPVTVTQSAQLVFEVQNTGTLPATISNIGIGSGPYTLSGLPSLPVTLAPNTDFTITIKFAPTTVGPANGTLLLDATSITLIGSGTQPPSLPAYTISGPSGNVTPMTQPTISLALASAYPVAITGTLAISVTGTLPADPAVQFSTGGQTVSFIIPANQINAVFGTQGTQIGLQTGTVADTITLTPTFATQTGAVDLTPASPPSLQFTVAPAAPTLIALQLSSITTTGFTIQVTGFSTTRSLKSWSVQLTPASGFALATSQFSIDVSQVSTVWFESTASQAYGGQFTISIPFTLGGLSTSQTIANALASVSVTMGNASGTSNSLQATVQ